MMTQIMQECCVCLGAAHDDPDNARVLVSFVGGAPQCTEGAQEHCQDHGTAERQSLTSPPLHFLFSSQAIQTDDFVVNVKRLIFNAS